MAALLKPTLLWGHSFGSQHERVRDVCSFLYYYLSIGHPLKQMKKKREQNHLEKILEVSLTSPPDETKGLLRPPSVSGDIYNSYYKIRQEKEEETRVKLALELKEKEDQISLYKEEVFDLKSTISSLEDKLQSFEHQPTQTIDSAKEAVALLKTWISRPQMHQSKRYILLSLLLYFSKHDEDKEWLLFGRITNLLLQLYEISNSN